MVFSVFHGDGDDLRRGAGIFARRATLCLLLHRMRGFGGGGRIVPTISVAYPSSTLLFHVDEYRADAGLFQVLRRHPLRRLEPHGARSGEESRALFAVKQSNPACNHEPLTSLLKLSASIGPLAAASSSCLKKTYAFFHFWPSTFSAHCKSPASE